MSNNYVAGRLTLLALLLTIFVDAVGLGVVYPVFTAAILKGSLSLSGPIIHFSQENFIFNGLLVVFPMAMFIGAPVLGALSDKYGRKQVLSICLLGNIVGFLICGFSFFALTESQVLILLFIGRIISGLSAGCVPVAQAAIADLAVGNEKASKLGWVSVANGLGFTLGPVVGLIFLNNTSQDLGLALPMFTLALLSFLTLLAIILFFQNAGSPKDPSIRINLVSGFQNILIAFKLKSSRVLVLAFSFYIVGYLGFFQYWPILLTKELHYSSSLVGYTISYYAIFFAVSLIFLLPMFMKRFQLKPILIGSLIVQLLCFLSLTLVLYHDHFMWILLIPMAISFSFCYVVSVSLASNVTAEKDQGKIMGVLGSLTALGWVLGPIIAFFSDQVNINQPLYLYAMLIILALVFALRFRKQQ